MAPNTYAFGWRTQRVPFERGASTSIYRLSPAPRPGTLSWRAISEAARVLKRVRPTPRPAAGATCGDELDDAGSRPVAHDDGWRTWIST